MGGVLITALAQPEHDKGKLTGAAILIYFMFMVIHFIVSTILKIILAVTSDIPERLFKLFHWIIF